MAVVEDAKVVALVVDAITRPHPVQLLSCHRLCNTDDYERCGQIMVAYSYSLL